MISGGKTGSPSDELVIVYVAVVMSLSIMPLLKALAVIVVETFTEIGLE